MQLPIELECFLIRNGFFEREHAPGYKAHAPVAWPVKTERPMGWTPSVKGEEPPF